MTLRLGGDGAITGCTSLENPDLTVSGLTISGSFDAEKVLVASGTAAAPSYTFSGDTDNGLYYAGTNAVAISTNGTAALTIDASQNVGIGTTSPISELHVENSSGNCGARVISGTSGVSYLNLGDTADNNIGSIEYDNAINALKIITNNNERMRIDSSGRVGIGSTPNSNEQFLVHGGGNSIYVPFARSSTKWITIHSGGTDHAIFCDTGGDIRFGHGNSRNAIDTEAARIDSSGRLLVGTSSSRGVGSGTQAGFQVETDASQIVGSFVVNYPSTTGAIISLAKSRSNSVGGSGLVQNDDDLGLIRFIGADGTDLQTVAASIGCQVDGTPGSNDMPGRLVFSTNPGAPATSPTERMRIDSSGTVLLNGATSNPTGANTSLYTDSASNTAEGITIKSTATSGNRFFIGFYNNANSKVGDIVYDGSTTAYNENSDYRLKENVAPLADGITRLKQLSPSRFNFIANPEKTVDGFLAHEIQNVVPEAVTGEKDAVNDDGNAIYQGIDKSKLVPLLTAALQEAIAKIETLEQRLTDAGL